MGPVARAGLRSWSVVSCTTWSVAPPQPLWNWGCYGVRARAAPPEYLVITAEPCGLPGHHLTVTFWRFTSIGRTVATRESDVDLRPLGSIFGEKCSTVNRLMWPAGSRCWIVLTRKSKQKSFWRRIGWRQEITALPWFVKVPILPRDRNLSLWSNLCPHRWVFYEHILHLWVRHFLLFHPLYIS